MEDDVENKEKVIISRSQSTIGERLGVSQSTISRMGRGVDKKKIVEVMHYEDFDGNCTDERKSSSKYQLRWKQSLANGEAVKITRKQSYTFASEGEETGTFFFKSSCHYRSSNQIRSTLKRARKTNHKQKSDWLMKQVVVGNTIVWCPDDELRKELLRGENRRIIHVICPKTRPKERPDWMRYVQAVKKAA